MTGKKKKCINRYKYRRSGNKWGLNRAANVAARRFTMHTYKRINRFAEKTGSVFRVTGKRDLISSTSPPFALVASCRAVIRAFLNFIIKIMKFKTSVNEYSYTKFVTFYLRA
ncbi:hypothetical protein PUN28_011406 [Cardiocondyla obscurior]|uniref:Ribosomal protein L20 n=1 Tax=Cardiocondyla obscurior TaxID=286306 RepID=A0AAW2FDP5_9HYME